MTNEKETALGRRQFLELAAGAAVLPTAKPEFYSGAETVTLGKTGIRTSRLCFGTGVKAGGGKSSLDHLGHDGAVALVRHAYEVGIRCFDMAHSYGTHKYIAEALKDYPRDSYTLITKLGCRKDTPVADRVNQFLKELHTDYLDVMQMHYVNSAEWDTELAPVMEALEKCKQAGKIRAHGLSMHARVALERATGVEWAEVCHVRINPFKVLMDGPVEDNVELCHKLKARGAGVIAMKILGEGWLSQYPEKIDQSVAFALTSGVMDVMAVGFLAVKEVDDMMDRIARVSKTVSKKG